MVFGFSVTCRSTLLFKQRRPEITTPHGKVIFTNILGGTHWFFKTPLHLLWNARQEWRGLFF